MPFAVSFAMAVPFLSHRRRFCFGFFKLGTLHSGGECSEFDAYRIALNGDNFTITPEAGDIRAGTYSGGKWFALGLGRFWLFYFS